MSPGASEHIFYQHLLHKQNAYPLVKPGVVEIWPSVYLLLCLGLLSLVKARAFAKVVKIVQSAYNTQALQQLEREESGQFKFYAIALDVFFILNLAFLIFKINLAFGFVLPHTTHFLQFLLFALLVLIIYGLKVTANRLIAFISREQRLISDYETSSFLINQASGLFLFPWIVLSQFSKFNPLIFVSGALITLAVSMLIKWYRGINVCLIGGHVGLLQIFSYFCGLEILPVIVLVKYVIETF